MAAVAISFGVSLAVNLVSSYLLTITTKLPDQVTGRLDDLRVMGSSYGTTIPQIFGHARIGGNIIWSTDLIEHVSIEARGGKGSPQQVMREYTYTVSMAVAICKGPIKGIRRIWAEDLLIYNDPTYPNTVNPDPSLQVITNASQYDITVHLGTEDQMPDAFIETILGSENVPAYRGMAYVVFSDMDLTAWNGRVPQMTFEPYTDEATVESILLDVCQQVGLDPVNDCDFNAADSRVTGFVIADRRAARDAVLPALSYYGIDLSEQDGKIIAVSRGGDSVESISVKELASRELPAGAADMNDGSLPLIEVRRMQDVELPSRIDLSYFSTTRNYEQSNQGAIRASRLETSLQSISISTGLVLTDDEARQGVERLMYEAWAERTTYAFSLPPSYLSLCTADTILLPIGDELKRVRITSMDIGMLAELRCEAVLDSPDARVQIVPGGSSALPSKPNLSWVPTVFMAWSDREVRDQDGVAPGFYVIGTGGDGWSGAAIYYSTDAGTTWLIGGNLTNRGVFGKATSSLADWSDAATLDTANEVEVQVMLRGSLENTSLTDIANGVNYARLGSELFHFATAVLQAPAIELRYLLSDLKRGQRDSVMTGHAIGDDFTLLTSAVQRVTVEESLIGETVLVKCVSPGQAVDNVAAVSIVIAQNSRPYTTPEETEAIQDAVNRVSAEVIAARNSASLGSFVSLDARLEEMETVNKGAKEPCRVTTTGNITLSGAQTIDSVAVVAGERVLVKAQTIGGQNGIYLVAAGAWVRSVDFDTSTDAVSGCLVPVSEGTVAADTLWQLTTNAPITLGATTLSFAQVSGGSSGMANPMTTLGDVIYGGTAPAGIPTRLAGNSTTTRKFLRQTGTGTVSATPAWDTLVVSDLPIMGASGGSHAAGVVPDPGSTAGTTKFLCEDGTWKLVGSSGGVSLAPPTSATNVIVPSVANTRALAVQANNSGSQNLFQVLDNTGTVTATLRSSGAAMFGSSASPSAYLHAVSAAGATPVAIIQGALGQSADLLQLQDSGSIVKGGFNNAGFLGVGKVPTSGWAIDVENSNNTLIQATYTGSLSSTSGGGYAAAITATPSSAGQRLGYFVFGSRSIPLFPAAVGGFSDGAWTGSSSPTYISMEVTPSGSNTRVEKARLTSAGLFGVGFASGLVPHSTIHSSGSFAVGYTLASSSMTLGANDCIVLAAGGQTITLPDTTSITGRCYTIKKYDSTGLGNVTIATNNSKTIDGVSTYTLSTQYQAVTVMNTGNNWFIIAKV